MESSVKQFYIDWFDVKDNYKSVFVVCKASPNHIPNTSLSRIPIIYLEYDWGHYEAKELKKKDRHLVGKGWFNSYISLD